MGFRFQRRINTGRGTGLNLSKSGVGASHRGRWGAIGTHGFSIRSGIRGLSFRQNWSRKQGGGAAAAIAVFAVFYFVIMAAAVVVAGFVTVVLPLLWRIARWCWLTASDYVSYLRTGQQPEVEE